MTKNRIRKILEIFDDFGPIVKASILRENKLCSRDIMELIKGSYIVRLRSGYYALENIAPTLTDIEIASSIIKNGVICLYSAAQIYDLSTINQFTVSVAIASDTIKPVLPKYPPIELFVFTNRTFQLGVEIRKTENSEIRIFNPERVVCDFFRLRNKIGQDIALEVIKNYMARKNKNIQMLMEYAGKMRIKTKMKPYVEALL